MKSHPREILLYYNPESSADKKTLAYAQSVSKHVRSFSHHNNRSTTTAWQVMLKSLDLHPKKLFNKALPEYQSKLRGKEFNHEGWLRVLQNNPHLIKSPIAIKGRRVILIETPTDILKLIA